MTPKEFNKKVIEIEILRKVIAYIEREIKRIGIKKVLKRKWVYK